MNKATSPSAAALVQATQTALGSHPDDIAGMMKSSSDVMDWLSDIFLTIIRETEAQRSPDIILDTIRKRATYGQYLADDFSNLADCEHEKVERAMAAAGIGRGAGHE